MGNAILHPAEPVAAQMGAAEPAGDDDDVVGERRPLEHPDDHYARAGLAVVVLYRAVLGEQGPGVVGGLGEFLLALELLEEGERVLPGGSGPAGDGVLGAAVGEDVVVGGEGHDNDLPR